MYVKYKLCCKIVIHIRLSILCTLITVPTVGRFYVCFLILFINYVYYVFEMVFCESQEKNY